MKSNLELKLDLVYLQSIRQMKQDRLLKDMFLGKEPFNEELYAIIQDNQWTDIETKIL